MARQEPPTELGRKHVIAITIPREPYEPPMPAIGSRQTLRVSAQRTERALIESIQDSDGGERKRTESRVFPRAPDPAEAPPATCRHLFRSHGVGEATSVRTCRWLASAFAIYPGSVPRCDLLLRATFGVTIPIVSSRQRKRWQPGLASDDPELVSWPQLVGGIQGSQVHFDLVCAA